MLWLLLLGIGVVALLMSKAASCCSAICNACGTGCAPGQCLAPAASAPCCNQLTQGACDGTGTVDFTDKVTEIANELGIEAGWLMACMQFESGLSPSIINSASRAVGLIQFLPRTANALGITTDALAGMTDTQQLDYVYLYLQPYTGRMQNIGDVYMAIFWPAAIGQTDDFVLFRRGSLAYSENSGLDSNGDGIITRGEAYAKVNAIYEAQYA